MAKKYKCIKKCFFRSRVYKPGETLAPVEGEVVPKHFKLIGGKEEVVEEKPEGDEAPQTFKDLAEQHASEQKHAHDFVEELEGGGQESNEEPGAEGEVVEPGAEVNGEASGDGADFMA